MQKYKIVIIEEIKYEYIVEANDENDAYKKLFENYDESLVKETYLEPHVQSIEKYLENE